MMKFKHPRQRVCIDDYGTARFVENKIVRHLVDSYPGMLNALADQFGAEVDDYEQLMMLIGYSVDGYAELRCRKAHRLLEADAVATALTKKGLTQEAALPPSPLERRA